MVGGKGTLEGLAVTPSFWGGKRVLVTGHTGFKGSWLCLWLKSLGSKVSGYALVPHTQPSLFEAARGGGGVDRRGGDVGDAAAMKAAVETTQPQVVIHMAAQSLVRLSYETPVETY